MRKWSVAPCEVPFRGIIVSDGLHPIRIRFEEIEEFMKHVFSAATGREFMGAHFTTPREGAGDE